MDKIATELYDVLKEIQRSAERIKIFAAPIGHTEKQIIEANFRFIKERGDKAIQMYEDALVEEGDNNDISAQ